MSSAASASLPASSRPRACCNKSASASSRPSMASIRSGCSESTFAYSGNASSGAPSSFPAARAMAAFFNNESMPSREDSRFRNPSATGVISARGASSSRARSSRRCASAKRSCAVASCACANAARATSTRPSRAAPRSGSIAIAAVYSSFAPLPSAAVRWPASSASCACSSRVSTWSCGHRRSSAATRSKGSDSSSHNASAAARCAQVRQSVSADAMRGAYASLASPACVPAGISRAGRVPPRAIARACRAGARVPRSPARAGGCGCARDRRAAFPRAGRRHARRPGQSCRSGP